MDKKRFFQDINKFYQSSEKIEVIYQSTNKTKVDITKKKR